MKLRNMRETRRCQNGARRALLAVAGLLALVPLAGLSVPAQAQVRPAEFHCPDPQSGQNFDICANSKHLQLWVVDLSEPHHPPEVIMQIRWKICVNRIPRALREVVAPWKFHSPRQASSVGVYRRTLEDIPDPGDCVIWVFPDTLPPHHELLLRCEPGAYYALITLNGVSRGGVPEKFIKYFPYNVTKPDQSAPPSRMRSWHVNCRKAGQVPNPKGE